MQLPSSAVPVESKTQAANESAANGSAASGSTVSGNEANRASDTTELAEPMLRSRALPLGTLATRFDVVFVGCLALVATLAGHALGPALPGTSAGIGPLIASVERIAAFSSQFLAVLGVVTCVRLLISTLDFRSRWFRLAAVATSAAGLPIVISASSRHLPSLWLVALLVVSGLLGLVCALPATRAAHSRAAGLVVLAMSLGSLVGGAGRIVALYASEEGHTGLFGLARGIATACLLLDALGVALGAIWVGRRSRYGAVLMAFGAGLALVGVWGGLEGAEMPDPEAWQLLAGRALGALTAHPDPFIDVGFRYFVEIYAILVAAVTLWFRRPSAVGQALSFALLARVSGDVPACALLLMLSGLCAVRASLERTPPEEVAFEPPGRRAPLEVVPATR